MSKLRAVKPESSEQRLKLFLYGKSGVGKTYAAFNFPKPYILESENSSEIPQYSKILEKNGGVVFKTQDFSEIVKEVKLLLSEKHDFKTLVIDSMTHFFDNLVEQVSLKTGTDFGRHYSEANRQMKNFLSLIRRLDMSVVVIAHCKNEYGTNLSILGQTFDCFKKMDYEFDLVLRPEKLGKKYTAIVEKTRLESFPSGERIDFSYDEISKRYGTDIFEREAVPEKLATNEQIEELKYLINILHEPEENIQKWFKKANISSFDEFNFNDIAKLIAHLKNKINLNSEDNLKIIDIKGAA